MSLLLDGYWPWWLGSIGLFSVVALVYLVERRHLGVSGSVARLVGPEDPTLRSLAADPVATQRAIIEATLAEFGDALSEEEVEELKQAAAKGSPRTQRWSGELARSVHAVFLAMVLCGGAISAIATDSWELSGTLGPTHELFFASGWSYCAILLIGGVCVGVGTRMAGGCTSGHGLTGCGRMQVSSLIATGVFLAAGAATSLLLDWRPHP